MPSLIDLTGQTFGRLKVLHRGQVNSAGRVCWVAPLKCIESGTKCILGVLIKKILAIKTMVEEELKFAKNGKVLNNLG